MISNSRERKHIIDEFVELGGTCSVFDMSNMIAYWNWCNTNASDRFSAVEWRMAEGGRLEYNADHSPSEQEVDLLPISEDIASYEALADDNCRFGIVVSDGSVHNASFRIAEILAVCGDVPDSIDKVLCIGRGTAWRDADSYIRKLISCGIVLVYDDSGELDELAMLHSSLVSRSYNMNNETCCEYIYNGEPPQAYSAKCKMYEMYRRYSESKKTVFNICREFTNVLDYFLYDGYVEKAVEAISYGFLSRESRPENPWNGHLACMFFPCKFSKEPVLNDCADAYEQEFSPYRAVALIWKNVLESCVELSHAYEARSLDELLELGRVSGVRDQIEAYFRHNVPLDDLVA